MFLICIEGISLTSDVSQVQCMYTLLNIPTWCWTQPYHNEPSEVTHIITRHKQKSDVYTQNYTVAM